MSMDFDDFFDTTIGPARDKHERPLLIPRGGTEDDRKPYTRASSLADMIEDFTFLHTWEKRYLARGMALRMDLCRLAAAEPYTTGFDKGEDAINRASGKRLDEIIERALDAVKIHEKADYGTAVHARTEPGNDGTDPDQKQQIEVRSFWEKVKELGIVIIDTEVFTANDELGSAGTFDHLMYVPGIGIVVTDKKTSSKAKETYDVQLAGYANSDVCDYQGKNRQTLEEFVESKGWSPDLIRRDIGYLIWIKNGKTTFHPLDLDAGYEAAKVAAWVRDNHRTKGSAKNATDDLIKGLAEQRGILLEAIVAAESEQELLEIWEWPEHQAIWTDTHTEAAKTRKAALTS